MKNEKFILELLNSKKTTKKQKQKIIELTKRDGNFHVLERLLKLEEVVFKKIDITKNNSTQTKKSQRKKEYTITEDQYKDPKYNYQFLSELRTDTILKIISHPMDDDDMEVVLKEYNLKKYNFETHLNKIQERFMLLNDKYPFASKNLKTLVKVYLTGTDFNGTSQDWATNIKINWNCIKLKNWAKENEGLPPNPSEEGDNIGFDFANGFIPENSNVVIQNFTDLTHYFKSLCYLRGDNSLLDIITSVNKKFEDKIDFKICESNFPRNINFHTDVDKLKQAYIKILGLIIEYKRDYNPEVSIYLREKKNSIEFTIHHINSTYGKTIHNTIEDELGKTYSSLIKYQLNGLCNFYVKADFGGKDNCAEINIWNGERRKQKQILSFKGVAHVLEFKKNK